MMVANKTRRTPGRRAFKTLFDVIQQAPGAYDEVTGKYVPGGGGPTVIGLKGSIQPSDGDMVDQLPENERYKDSISIWTDGIDPTGALIRIRSARFGSGTQTQGDQIDFDGFKWDVWKVEDYRAHGHQEILALKSDGQEG